MATYTDTQLLEALGHKSEIAIYEYFRAQGCVVSAMASGAYVVSRNDKYAIFEFSRKDSRLSTSGQNEADYCSEIEALILAAKPLLEFARLVYVS